MARNNLVNMIGRLSEEQVARLKCDMGTDNIALLNNRDGFPVFQFGKHTIRFRAPYSPDMCEIKKSAQRADFIVNSYSFFCQDSMVRVLILNNPAFAAIPKPLPLPTTGTGRGFACLFCFVGGNTQCFAAAVGSMVQETIQRMGS